MYQSFSISIGYFLGFVRAGSGGSPPASYTPTYHIYGF